MKESGFYCIKWAAGRSRVQGGFWRGWGGSWCVGNPGRARCNWGLWSLAIYGEGLQYHTFLDSCLFASERGLVFKVWLCPGPLFLLGGGWDFDSGHSWRSQVSPLHTLQLPDLRFWSLVSKKQLSTLLETQEDHFELVLQLHFVTMFSRQIMNKRFSPTSAHGENSICY